MLCGFIEFNIPLLFVGLYNYLLIGCIYLFARTPYTTLSPDTMMPLHHLRAHACTTKRTGHRPSWIDGQLIQIPPPNPLANIIISCAGLGTARANLSWTGSMLQLQHYYYYCNNYQFITIVITRKSWFDSQRVGGPWSQSVATIAIRLMPI